MKIKQHIPNILTLFRIFSILPFFYFLLNKNFLCAFVIFIVASLSDFFDGYLARKFKVETKIGALLDPLADKLFSNSVLWGLCFLVPIDFRYFCVYLILAVILTLRDIILILGSLFVVSKKLSINLKPIFISKICTTLIFTFIAFSIAFVHSNLTYDFLHPILEKMNLTFGYNSLSLWRFATYYIGLPLGYLCVFLVIITFCVYIFRFFRSSVLHKN